MKNLLFIFGFGFTLLLASCKQAPATTEETVVVDSTVVAVDTTAPVAVVDTTK